MLSPFDDHPIHQLVAPVTQLGTGDRNVFERYRFHGARPDGSLAFGCTMGLYPNRELIDASLTVVIDGVQHSAHASARLAAGDRRTEVAPFELQVVEALHTFRFLLDGAEADELGLRADLTFQAVGPPLEGARHAVPEPGGRGRDTVGFSQWGRWDGVLDVDGTRLTTEDASVGWRERVWGTAPIGEPAGGAPRHELPQRCSLRCEVHLPDQFVAVDLEEDAQGRRRHTAARRTERHTERSAERHTGRHTERGGEPLRDATVAVEWHPGTRRPRRAQLTVAPWNATPFEIELRPMADLALRGLGYESPDWRHGTFKGEAVVGREQWVVDDLDPTDVHNLHVHQVCEARVGDQRGVAVLEALVVGPHAPSGLTGFADGAGARTP